MRSRGFKSGYFLIACVCGLHAQSEVPPQLTPFLVQHCFDCHTGDTPEGGLDLQKYSRNLADAEVRRRWVELYDRMVGGEMPPASETQPAAAAKTKFLQTLGDSLSRADRDNHNVILRRLNRREYENTVRDLFGIYVDIQRLLPDDAVAQGVDTNGSALSLSAEHMVLYVEAADVVLDQVFGPAEQPETISLTGNFATAQRGTDSSERKLQDGVVLFSGAKFLPLYDISLPGKGLYRVRVKICAEQSEAPVVLHVLGGNTGAVAAHTVGFFEALPDQITTIEFTDRNPEQSDCFAFGLVGGYPWWKVDEKEYQGAGLFIGDIEIEGPIESWPPPSRQQLLGDIDPAHGTLDDIGGILSRQLRRAFRREIDSNEVDPYVALASRALDEGLSFEKALRRGLKGIICAPEFLFLEERPATNQQISDFALASRLSYFLWSSMPDRKLFSLASRDKLHNPEKLRIQVERMLAGPKSELFVESFTG